MVIKFPLYFLHLDFHCKIREECEWVTPSLSVTVQQIKKNFKFADSKFWHFYIINY